MYSIVVYNKTRRRQILKRFYESRATAEKAYKKFWGIYVDTKQNDNYVIIVHKLPGDWKAVPERELQDWKYGAD